MDNQSTYKQRKEQGLVSVPVWVTRDLRRLIKIRAAEQDLKMNDVIVAALEAFLIK